MILKLLLCLPQMFLDGRHLSVSEPKGRERATPFVVSPDQKARVRGLPEFTGGGGVYALTQPRCWFFSSAEF